MANSLYKVTPGQAQPPLASDINQFADTLTGAADIGQITLASPITAPGVGTVTATATTGTSLGIGTYRYKFTYVTGTKKSDNTVVLGNETSGSASVSVTTTSGNQAVNLASLPTSWPSTAVALRIYRTAVGGADGTQKLVATITTPSATYSDTTADGSLSTAVPTVNTTGITVSGLVLAADPTTALGAATRQYVDAPGSVTDAKIGNRTIDDTLTPSTGPNTLTNLLSFLGNMIRQITGKSSWITAPRTTLENAVKLNGDTMTGDLVIGGAWPIILTNSGAPANPNRAYGALANFGDGLAVQSKSNAGANTTAMFSARTNDGVEYFGVKNGGVVTSKNNTFDNGSGGATFAGGVGVGGTLSVPSFNGVTQFINGNADNASYSQFNTKMHLHWGLGIETYDGTINGYYDSRLGLWDVKGGFKINGSPVYYAGNHYHQSRMRIYNNFNGNATTTSSNAVLGLGTVAIFTFKYNASEWSKNNFVAEFVVSQSGGATGYYGIWNITNNGQVANSEVSAAAGGAYSVLRTGAFTLIDGNVYTIYLRTNTASVAVTVYSADIINI